MLVKHTGQPKKEKTERHNYFSPSSDNKTETFINKPIFISCKMDYHKPEKEEIAKVVDQYYANGGLEDIQGPLTKEAVELAIVAIKKGLEAGVDEFYKNNGTKTIDKSNINDFMKDYNTANKVIYELRQLPCMTEEVDIGIDACETYRTVKYQSI